MINEFRNLNATKYFSSWIFQNYLVFMPAKNYIGYFSGTTRINSSKFSNFARTFVDHHILNEIDFYGHCLINNNISIPKNVINLYISYTLKWWLRNLNTYYTLNNCLFGSVSLSKNADPHKYKHCGYGIEFEPLSELLFTDGSREKRVFLFGANMNSSVHADNKNRDILILGEGPLQGLDDITLTGEAKYPINFT